MNSETVNSAYHTIRNKKWLNTIVILTRFLIGFAFIPSGLKKVMGVRFTQLSISEPIGFFFEALYRSGIYWNFLGWAQLIAALLLMTQRFATLGAIFFFFIISNIWMITLSLNFSGTWVIIDRMFGTAVDGEAELLGMEGGRKMSIGETMVYPFSEGWKTAKAFIQRRSESSSAVPAE